MAQPSNQIDIYLEIGVKRTFAGAIEWPGWSRGGPDEQSALQNLLKYGPRYAQVLATDLPGFKIPNQAGSFDVVERVKGNTTTEFGTPNLALASDTKPVKEIELGRFHQFLEVCWKAFDRAVRLAAGKQLRKGPRGGGRELDGIIEHVLEGSVGYLGAMGWNYKKDTAADLSQRVAQVQEAVRDALTARAHGEIPEIGPRGGVRWTVRYFVRREAWHILDHAWEIEDRIE